MGSLALPYKYFNYPEYTWENRPTKAQVGSYAVFTDIGISREIFFWTGTRWAPINGTILLGQSNTNSAVTGTLTSTDLAAVTLKGGFASPNSIIEIISMWSYPNSANNKTLRIKLGSSSFFLRTETTTVVHQAYTCVRMANSTSSQVSMYEQVVGGFGTSTSAPFSASIDTSSDQNIVFQAQLTNTGETITLNGYRIMYRE